MSFGAARSWLTRARSVAELLAVVFALYAMVSATPLGAVLRYGVNRALGHRVKRPSLARFFDSEAERARASSSVVLAFAEQGRARPPGPGPEPELSGVRPPLARALRFVLQSRERAPRLEALPALLERLGSEQAAVAALATDEDDVARALEQARGLGAPLDTPYEAFRPFLPAAGREAADELIAPVFALVVAQEMSPPVQGRVRISSGFGYRRHPILKTKRFHTGIDLAVPVGTELYAVAPGKVVYAGEDSVNGKFVKLDHGFGLQSAYCHASELLVKRGESLEAGAKLAKSGESGRATGPHLHFQLSLGGKPIDPMLFYGDRFNARLSVHQEVGGDGGGLAALEPHPGEGGAGDREPSVVDQPELHVEETFVEQAVVAQASLSAARADRVR